MTCSKCKTDKSSNNFNKSSRHLSGLCPWCKDCENERKKIWAQKNPNKIVEYSRNHREKNKEQIYAKNLAREKAKHLEKLAKMAVARAIKRGDLIRPKTCTHCNKDCKPEGHHFDYTKRLDVIWLCKSCHAKEHVRLRNVATWSEKK